MQFKYQFKNNNPINDLQQKKKKKKNLSIRNDVKWNCANRTRIMVTRLQGYDAHDNSIIIIIIMMRTKAKMSNRNYKAYENKFSNVLLLTTTTTKSLESKWWFNLQPSMRKIMMWSTLESVVVFIVHKISIAINCAYESFITKIRSIKCLQTF